MIFIVMLYPKISCSEYLIFNRVFNMMMQKTLFLIGPRAQGQEGVAAPRHGCLRHSESGLHALPEVQGLGAPQRSPAAVAGVAALEGGNYRNRNL